MTMRLMLLADNKNRVKDEKIHFNIQPGWEQADVLCFFCGYQLCCIEQSTFADTIIICTTAYITQRLEYETLQTKPQKKKNPIKSLRFL